MSEPAPRGIFDPELLDACISCGFCLPACPTYTETKVENSSPRGRITLMRALEQGRLDPDDATLQAEAALCLGCRACETVCPAGVRYGELLEQWRDHQWRGHHTPPVAGALRAGVRMTPLIELAGRVRGAAKPTPDPGTGPQLMLGCLERSLYPHVSQAVLKLAPELEVPAQQGCCGALHAHNAGSGQARELAQQLGRHMPGTIVTTSGGCAAYLAHQLGREKVQEISEYLALTWQEHPDKVPALAALTCQGRTARVAIKDSCQLRNGLGVVQPARSLVNRIAEYVELPAEGACCGGAGTYSMLQPDMSKRVLEPFLEQVREHDLDYIVSLNVVCTRQLKAGVKRAGLRARVVHLVELLELALAGPS